MLIPNDSDLDSMDPELLSQLPLQSDVEQYIIGNRHAMDPDMSSMISESNLDIDATENDEMLIHQQQNQQENQHQSKAISEETKK